MGEDYEAVVRKKMKGKRHKSLEEEAEEYWDKLQRIEDGKIEEEEDLEEDY